jgi:hypothetical protein
VKKDSKKLEQCTYCTKLALCTDDHVFPRTILQKIGANYKSIKVRACEICNNRTKSKLDAYVSYIFSLSSNLDLNEKQLRGYQSLPIKTKLAFANGKRQLIKLNGIYQDQVLINIDWNQIEQFCKFVSKGLIFHHKQIFVDQVYKKCEIDMLPFSIDWSSKFATTYQNSNLFRDDGLFENKINYLTEIKNDTAIVIFQIFNPALASTHGNHLSKIFRIRYFN